jgi:hypothetical protein
LLVYLTGYSKANGQGKPFFFTREIGLGHPNTNLLGYRHPALQIGNGAQNEEFLSSPPGQEVLASQVFPFDKPF